MGGKTIANEYPVQIRCSRSLPTCGTCVQQNLECCYPQRRPRVSRAYNQKYGHYMDISRMSDVEFPIPIADLYSSSALHVPSPSLPPVTPGHYCPTPTSTTTTESHITTSRRSRSPLTAQKPSSISSSIFADLGEAIEELRKQKLRELKIIEIPEGASLGIPPSVATAWINSKTIQQLHFVLLFATQMWTWFVLLLMPHQATIHTLIVIHS